MDNQFWLSVILLWKVDLRVIVNSPSCLSFKSQVTDQILICVLDKRYCLTSEIDLLISLYSLGRSGSDTEPSSTEGSSWRCSGEPGLMWNWGSMGWSSPYIPPCSDSLPLSWQQVYCLFMENQYESGADSGVSSSSSFSLSPPLVGGDIVESSLWVLTLRWCQSSRLLDVWILGTWQSSLTLEGILTLAGFLWSPCFLFLPLVVFRTLVGLPDSCWSSGLFWSSWLLRSFHIC